jgi:adenylate kinase family enzyme
VAVIGCGGAGKTTLANALGARLGLPVVHIDGVFWRSLPDGSRVESPRAEWEAAHRSLIAERRWVIDGMKLGVLDERLAAADTVVFLDLPTRTCLWGVLRRRDGVSVNSEFLRWIWGFRRVHRPRVLALLAASSCDVIQLRSRREARQFAAGLPARIGS